MNQKQLEQAAQVDIRYFLRAYKECPTCKLKFEFMHPAANIVPHWRGTCLDAPWDAPSEPEKHGPGAVPAALVCGIIIWGSVALLLWLWFRR